MAEIQKPGHDMTTKGLVQEMKKIFRFFLHELKPKGNIFTVFNIISAPIIFLGFLLIVYRFAKGLGSATNLTQDYPWGLWIGFDVITGVALAGGGYIIPFMVYMLGLKKYHAVVRPAVLTALLGYIFYAGALVLDLGRPWHIVNPMIGNDFGVSSVLFLVAWHFFLYIVCQVVEFSPAAAEWLGYKRIRKIVGTLTVGAVIFGITLSTLHQSGLGALYQLAPTKLHPLWYTHVAIFFFISSIFAGLSMVIAESAITHRIFAHMIDPHDHHSINDIVIGLGKAASVVMFVYFGLKLIDVAHSGHWKYFTTPMGYLYLLEIIGFVFIPMLMFAEGVRRRNVRLIQVTSFITVAGVILNRANVTMIAFKNWYAPVTYFPSWMEFTITAAIILLEVWAFRWIVNRMPVMKEDLSWMENGKVINMDKEGFSWKTSVM
jgi:Ni/Fe-hydrogenase subunit HybB-like protein